MVQNLADTPFSELINSQNYNIDSLETEIRADQHCTQLLKYFHRWLLDEHQFAALEAGQLAAGVDYFLREFLIGAKRLNIFSATADQLRQFGGNWYIISNLEPNTVELDPMLHGTALFYSYLEGLNLFKKIDVKAIDEVAQNGTYFIGRIEDFHQLKDNGYSAWDQACSLK